MGLNVQTIQTIRQKLQTYANYIPEQYKNIKELPANEQQLNRYGWCFHTYNGSDDLDNTSLLDFVKRLPAQMQDIAQRLLNNIDIKTYVTRLFDEHPNIIPKLVKYLSYSAVVAGLSAIAMKAGGMLNCNTLLPILCDCLKVILEGPGDICNLCCKAICCLLSMS